jgi:DNA-binding GntR family transcriptional regulator
VHKLPSLPAADSVSPASRREEAYEQIRTMISDAELAAGSHITEAALVRRLKMSRTLIREALARLVTEGQLFASPVRGFVVVEVSSADLIDIYAVRVGSEGLAAASAASRITRVDLARLDDAYEAMDDAVKQGADNELATLNSEYHGIIAGASGNAHLQAMLDGIHEVFDRFRSTALALPGRRSDAHREHGLLISSLRARDRATARQVAEDQVRRALETRRRQLEPDGVARATRTDRSEITGRKS